MNNFLQKVEYFLNIISSFLAYRIATVHGNEIKVNNILLSICIFFIGFKLNNRLRSAIKEYISHKSDIDKDTANILEKVIAYTLYTIFVILILQISNIPIAVFSFIGAALAVGIGLGTQTLINNLISGLILMIEKPIKIGDIIELSGQIGTVVSINARCTVISTFNNTDILIPNSKLLQEDVINWTYNDNIIRGQLEIKTEQQASHNIVLEIMYDVLKNNNNILKYPNPSAYLIEINEIGAKYEINFYCDIAKGANIKLVKTEINTTLVTRFKEQNIKLAEHYIGMGA